MRCPQDLEDLVEAFLTDYVTYAYILCVVCGNPYGEIALSNLENEIFLLLTLDGADFDSFDQRRTVMGVYDGVSDLKNHLSRAPFDLSSLTRDRFQVASTVQVRGTEA